ncbi:MAG: phytanoyl-CoA dioxygenase family protein [Streptosporangiaceae bacterium]
METDAIVSRWRSEGYVVLPAFMPAGELAGAVAELGLMFPTAGGFHDRTDQRYERYLADEFAGIDSLPFASTEVSLLAVHDRIIGLAESVLGARDIRIYSAEAWAKYTGAADYDQALHRDYLNHTILAPSSDAAFQQAEFFLYLRDVPEELGPPHFVSHSLTAALPARPNWYPRRSQTDDEQGWVATTGSPELYESEESAGGPAGTVVAFQLGTFHRGTAMKAPRGARYTMHLGYRLATGDWGQRHAWASRSHDPCWYQFVSRASPRQLELFGFPPPGHAYWTRDTLSDTALRYPGMDLEPWRSAVR